MPIGRREPTRSSVPNEIKRGGVRRYLPTQQVQHPNQCPRCDAPMVDHTFVVSDEKIKICTKSCGWKTCAFCSMTFNLRTRMGMIAGYTDDLFRELDWEGQESEPGADDPGPD